MLLSVTRFNVVNREPGDTGFAWQDVPKHISNPEDLAPQSSPHLQPDSTLCGQVPPPGLLQLCGLGPSLYFWSLACLPLCAHSCVVPRGSYTWWGHFLCHCPAVDLGGRGFGVSCLSFCTNISISILEMTVLLQLLYRGKNTAE